MVSSLIARLVIWRGWLCGANPAATARVDSRIASFMMVIEVRKVWDRWSQRQGMIIFDGGGDFLLMRHVRVLEPVSHSPVWGHVFKTCSPPQKKEK